MQSHIYKNGAYSADGTYRSPAGGESVSITLTLKDDVITDATFVGHTTSPKSERYQGLFADGFKEYVVGKSIDELSLTVVNGSSLTGAGFMDAVAKIKAEAKA
jgi:NifU-like protein involved in Fe-S cluster formation